MPKPNKTARAPLLWLLPVLMLTACATKLQPTPPPVVGEKPKATVLPASIYEIAPPPSGTYFDKLTAWRKSSRDRLSSTPIKSEP